MKTNFHFVLIILAGLAASGLSLWGRTVSATQRPLTIAGVPTKKVQRFVIERTKMALASGVAPEGLTPPAGLPTQTSIWTTGARLRHRMGSVAGTLKIDAEAIEFQSPKNRPVNLPFSDIQTLDLYPGRVVITTYEARGRFRPGVRRYRFDLQTAMPPSVAAELSERLGRPARNGNPEPDSPAFATIPAQHRTGFGGTKSNGILRFGKGGIEYVTQSAKDSRSWRWADIQTLSSLDPYRLVVFGYRDTYSFGLKQPMTRELLNRLTDEIYRHHPLDRGSARYAGN